MLMAKKKMEAEDSRVTEGGRRPTGETRGANHSGGRPDPEVSTKATRRRFTARYKLEILRQSDRCTKPGEVGALLRREGIYSSSLSAWRRARERGELAGLTGKKRGRKPRARDERDEQIAVQGRTIKRLEQQLAQAETIIDIQKKVASMLGIPLKSIGNEGND